MDAGFLFLKSGKKIRIRLLHFVPRHMQLSFRSEVTVAVVTVMVGWRSEGDYGGCGRGVLPVPQAPSRQTRR